MRKNWWFPVAVAVAALIVIATIGCSKKDKGTDAREITPEEQFATFEQYVGSVDDLGTKTAPMIGSSAGAMFWDGVQQDDYPDFGLGFLSLLNFGGSSQEGILGLIPTPLGKRIPDGTVPSGINGIISSLVRSAAVQSDGYQYDAERGWWVIDVDTTMEQVFAEQGITGHVSIVTKLRDSVRFDNTLTGTVHEQPSLITDRLRHGSKVGLSISLTLASQEMSINLKSLVLNSSGADTVTGLNTSAVTLDGGLGFDASVDLSAVVPDTIPGSSVSVSAKGGGNLDARSSGIEIAKSTDPCPTAGSLNAGLGVDIAASRGNESERAKGNWDMTIDFVGGGNVHVAVESGDFIREADAQACQPSR